jgi:hypothetical protein
MHETSSNASSNTAELSEMVSDAAYMSMVLDAYLSLDTNSQLIFLLSNPYFTADIIGEPLTNMN